MLKDFRRPVTKRIYSGPNKAAPFNLTFPTFRLTFTEYEPKSKYLS